MPVTAPSTRLDRRPSRRLPSTLWLAAAALVCLTAANPGCSRDEPTRPSSGKATPHEAESTEAEASAAEPDLGAQLRKQALPALEAGDEIDRQAFASRNAPPHRAGMYRGGLASMSTATGPLAAETTLELARLYELTAPDLVAMPVAASLATRVADDEAAPDTLRERARGLATRYRKAAAARATEPAERARARQRSLKGDPRIGRVRPTLPCPGGNCDDDNNVRRGPRRAPIIEKRPGARQLRDHADGDARAVRPDTEVRWLEATPQVRIEDPDAMHYTLVLGRGLTLDVPMVWPIDGPLPEPRTERAVDLAVEILVPQLPASASEALRFERLRWSTPWRPAAARPGTDLVAGARSAHTRFAAELCDGPPQGQSKARHDSLDLVSVTRFAGDCTVLTLQRPGNMFVSVAGSGVDDQRLLARVAQLLASDKAAP